VDLKRLNQFPSVAANAVSTLVTSQLIDTSVHALVLEMGGTTFTKAHITNIRVRLDGKDLLNGISGAQLQDLNDYFGLPDVTNYLVIPFGDPTARTVRGQHLGDLDCSVYRKPLELEITIGAATAPTLQAHAWYSVPKLAMGIGFDEKEAMQLRSLIRTIIQPAAAVTRSVYNISLGGVPGGRVRAFEFFHTNLTKVDYKKSSLIKHEDVSIALNSALAQQYARVPQSGLYVLDRIVDGNQGEAESTIDGKGLPWNQEVALTTSAADTITCFADMFITWPQI